MPVPTPAPVEPRIAVVICTRDRPEALQETLESLWSQTRLPDELILIDDGQLPDDARDRIAARCHELGIAGQYARSAKRGLTASRNQAADLAHSDILQYLDDDVTCDVSFLAEIARVMSDPRVTAATAKVREPSFESPSARLYQLGYRLAGWWRIRPRGRPPGPPPRVLQSPRALPSPPGVLWHRRLAGAVTGRRPVPQVPAPGVPGAYPEDSRGTGVSPVTHRRDALDHGGQGQVGATVARWLCGAAMALRRDVVRAHRFDETLAEYALGEDREMGYRLAPHYWLVEARRAQVVHRRATGQRTNGRRLGFMTGFNYLHILSRTCRLGPGEWLLIGWSFAVLAAMHALWAIVGDRRRHLDELRGMLEGLLAYRRVGRQRRWVIELSSLSRPSGSAAFGQSCAGHGGPTLPAMNAVRQGARRSSPIHHPPSAIRDLLLSSLEAPAPVRRALFITNRLEPGGAERMLLSLGARLRSFDVEPFIGCLQDAGPLAGECHSRGISVFENLLHFKTDAAVLVRLRRILRDRRIDIIVAAHSGGDRMFWSTLAGRLARVPVVVWSHWFPLPPARHFERANRLLFRWVDAFVALGERHRQALIRREYVPAGRVIVIPNAIDLAPFVSSPSRVDARRCLGLADEQVAVAIIANLRPEKRHDVFIHAARRLASENPLLRFFIIGDGPHRQAVHAAAAASGLSPDVLRLLGPRNDVAALLPGIDISGLCSDLECFSITMLEAAAAGCAFIGPDSGCLPDFLEHRRTGLLIRPADVDSLTDAIRGLAADADLRRRLADAARAKVMRGFDLDSMARAFAGLLHGLTECPVIELRHGATSRKR